MAEAARTRDWGGLRWSGAAFVVAVCAAGLLFGTGRHASAAPGTPVCGTLAQGVTTWNAAGSPYLICDMGVFVNPGSTLNLDATLGAVKVQATGGGGLSVGGTVRTVNTSAVAHVSFDGPSATRGAWAGIGLGSAHYNTDTTLATLSYVDIAHAQTGIRVNGAKSVALDHIAVSESRGGVFADSPVSLTSSTVHGIDQEGIHVECFGLPVSVTDNAVDAAGWTGLAVGNQAGLPCNPLTVARNTITSSGTSGQRYPAMDLAISGVGVGSGQPIGDNVGAGNGLDAIALSGTMTSNLTWMAPTNSGTIHPLGYLDDTLRFTNHAVLTVPAGTVVKGGPYPQPGSPENQPPPVPSLIFESATLDASAGGAIFTSYADNTVGLQVCPSVLTSYCFGKAGDMGGISLSGDGASASLNSATIRYARTALSVGGGGGAGTAATLTNTSIDHSYWGVWSDSAQSVSVSGGTISDIQYAGIDTSLTKAVHVSGVHVVRAGADGITVAQGSAGGVALSGNTVDSAAGAGIRVEGSDDPTVRDNTILNSGTTGPEFAVDVGGCCVVPLTMSLGPTGHVDGNVGAGNAVNAVGLNGNVTNSFTWRTAAQSSTSAALGYVNEGAITMSGPLTLTVPANAVVKGSQFNLNGGTLDASAGGAIFTGLKDGTVGLPTCPMAWIATCEVGATEGFGALDVTKLSNGTRGGVSLVRAQLRRTTVNMASGATSAPGYPDVGLALDGTKVSFGHVSAASTPTLIRDSIVEGADTGVSVQDGSPATITNSVVSGNAAVGIDAGQPVQVTNSRVSGNGIGNTANGGGVALRGSGSTMSCTAVRGNQTGVFAGSASLDHNDLVGNTGGAGRYDLAAGVQVDARQNWWGQPGGPQPGQVQNPQNADTSNPLGAPSDCVPATPPDPPSSPSAQRGDLSAIVSWGPPADDGGSPVTSYTVTASPGGATTTVGGAATSAIVHGLSAKPYTFIVTATNAAGTSAPSTFTNEVTPTAAAGTYFPVSPARILDTRPAHALGPDASLQLQVTGAGGVPATGVSAVVLNVTGVAPTDGTFLTVWPAGEARPTASNLNLAPGQTAPNLVVAKVGSNGRVSIYNARGFTQVVVDVAGWYSDGSTPAGARYTALTPERHLDTRQFQPVGPDASIDMQVAGIGGVPAGGVSAVVLNITGTEPSDGTYLTVWPAGEARPTASNLNLAPGETRANVVVAKLGANGGLSIYNAQGSTHVIVDVAGWYSDGSTMTGARYTGVNPARILDTRASRAIPPNSSTDLQVTGAGGVPASGVSAVVLNVTGTDPTAGTFLTVWPAGEARPMASNLNLAPGQTVPNLVVAKVGANGRVSIYNAQGNTHVVVDVAGWFGADGA